MSPKSVIRVPPRRAHHRGGIDPSIQAGPQPRQCPEGTCQVKQNLPFCGRVPLNLRFGINDLAAAAGGENAAKLLNLTVPFYPSQPKQQLDTTVL